MPAPSNALSVSRIVAVFSEISAAPDSTNASFSRHFGQRFPGASAGNDAPHSLQVLSTGMAGLGSIRYYSKTRHRLHVFYRPSSAANHANQISQLIIDLPR